MLRISSYCGKTTLNRYEFIESQSFGRVGKFDLLLTFNAVES
jgi:hypothetical protein